MPGFSNTVADNATPRPPTDSLPLGAGAVEVCGVAAVGADELACPPDGCASTDCDCCIIVDWGVDGEAAVVLDGNVGVEV